MGSMIGQFCLRLSLRSNEWMGGEREEQGYGFFLPNLTSMARRIIGWPSELFAGVLSVWNEACDKKLSLSNAGLSLEWKKSGV